jgi:hypothetical protein
MPKIKNKCLKIKELHCPFCNKSYQLNKTYVLQYRNYGRNYCVGISAELDHLYAVGKNKTDMLDEFASIVCDFHQYYKNELRKDAYPAAIAAKDEFLRKVMEAAENDEDNQTSTDS